MEQFPKDRITLCLSKNQQLVTKDHYAMTIDRIFNLRFQLSERIYVGYYLITTSENDPQI
jgi:hypothetical protein